jgi:hypothetical protein
MDFLSWSIPKIPTALFLGICYSPAESFELKLEDASRNFRMRSRAPRNFKTKKGAIIMDLNRVSLGK